MKRLTIVTAGLLCAASLAACGISGEHDVSGTVQNVDYGGTGDGPVRYIKLEANGDVYRCSVNTVQECGVIREGHKVSMRVGYDEDYGRRLTVISLEYIESS